LNRSVPVADEVTSLSAIGPVAAGHHGPMAFTTTHWSVVVEAQGESPAAQEALEKLCRTYWRPIYSFILRQGAGTEDAEDLTQGFFALILEQHNRRQ
jgi:hypothetical protein